jgi:RP/EB family microtubule-associated protein
VSQLVRTFLAALTFACRRIGITKVVDVVALTRGSYQENLEFLQWLKAYYEQNVPQNLQYDPVGRREGKPHAGTASAAAVSASTTVAAATPAPVAAAIVETPASVVSVAAPVAAPASTRSSRTAVPAEKKPVAAPTTAPTTTTTRQTTAAASPAKSAPLRNAVNTSTKRSTATSSAASSSAELAELTKKYAALQLQLDRAEQERDFYFAKLRDVEIWTQTHPDAGNHAVRDVQSILYATDE